MTIFLRDTFTDADLTLLQNHTPDLGGAWVNLAGGADTDAEIISNGIQLVDIAAVYVNATPPSSADYDVLCTYNWDGTVGITNMGLEARNLDINNRIFVIWDNGTFALVKRVNGAFTDLDTLVENPPIGVSQWRLEVRGDTKTFFLDGVQKLTATEGEVNWIGLAGWNGQRPIAANSWTMDDFSAEVPGVSGPTVTLFGPQIIKVPDEVVAY